MTEKKPDAEETKAPPTVQQTGHKNPPVGPKTNTPQVDWRKDRDYENFNPTAEK